MALGELVTGYVSSLVEYMGADSKISPDKRELVESLLSKISSVSGGIDIGMDANGYITVDGVSYLDGAELENAIDVASTNSNYTNFFTLGSDYEFGIVNSSGGERMATAIMAATRSLQSSYEADKTNKVHIISNPNFVLRIYEYNPNADPVQYPNITVSCGLNGWTEVSMFNDADIRNQYSQRNANLHYQVIRLSGEALVKLYINETDAPEEEDDWEEKFEDVSINKYTIKDGSVAYNGSYETNAKSFGNGYAGGFAIIEMYNNSLSASYKDEDLWCVLFMSQNGAPLYTAMTLTGDASEIYANPLTFAPTITNSIDTKMHLAPIYSPSSLLYSSRNARWAIMRHTNGIYAVTSSIYRYRCDYGLCMKE